MAAAVAIPAAHCFLGWGPEVATDSTMQVGGVELGSAFAEDYVVPPGGSEMHGSLDGYGQPLCQPCAWFYKESGCLNAAPCKYCHLCPQGELKNRKKKKIARLRSEENAAQATGKSQGDLIVEEPAYVHLPDLDQLRSGMALTEQHLGSVNKELRRSKTAPPALERAEEDDTESTLLGLDVGLLPPPGLDSAAPPVLDPAMGFDQSVGMQMDCGPLFGAWGAASWPLDSTAAFGYDPQLAFQMAFQPVPLSPQEQMAMQMPPQTMGLMLPPPPEEPPALLEHGSPTTHPPPPPEQSPLGTLGHTVGDQAQVSTWPATSDDSLAADFQPPCSLLPADLQAEIQLDQQDLTMLGKPWEAPPDMPSLKRALTWPAANAPADSEGATVEQPELERVTTQTAVRMEEGEGGSFCVSWTVDARKLKASDKVAVSPAFQVPIAPGKFRMMLLPKVVDDRKGGASFKRAKGKGLVQVKCEENLEDPRGGVVSLRLSVRSGGPEPDSPDRQEPPRGPVTHDFAEKGIFGLPKGQEEWDFGKIVNGSQTFVVDLEVLPPSPPGSAAEAPLGPPPGLGRDAWGPLIGRTAAGVEDAQLQA